MSPDIIFVVTGAISSDNTLGATPTYMIPVGGAGSTFAWGPQVITYPTGQITASGSASNGSVQAHFSGQLAFSPTRGSDSYSTHVTVSVYVRGAEQCFRTHCASSGTIAVSHPQGCDPVAGPFVRATWNGQSVGSLSGCTADATLPITNEACSDSGTSCCTTVQFPGVPGVEYSLAMSKTFDGQVSQTTVGQLASGVPILATLDADITVSLERRCGPAPGPLCGLHFDGVDDRVTVPHHASFPSNEYTISGWLQTTSATGYKQIMSRGESNVDDVLTWGFGLHDGALYLQIENGPNTGGIYSGSSNVADGSPHHVAVTRSAGGSVALYVDGNLDGSFPTTVNPASSSEQDLQIGYELSATGPPPQTAENVFNGVLDELTLWNRALTPLEIAALNGHQLPASTTGLLGNWRLDEGKGQSAADSSGVPVLTAQLGTTAASDAADPFWVCVAPLPPDLSVTAVHIDRLATDCQNLMASGFVTAVIKNLGEGPVTSGFGVRFFEDRNGNGVFDSGLDLPIGDGAAPGGLAAGAEVSVEAAVNPVMVEFDGNLVYALADPGNGVLETDEANNVGNSGTSCQRVPSAESFNPTLKWAWTSSTVQPTALNVGCTPAVIDLDGDGIPEIVFSSGIGQAATALEPAFLRAIHGNNGSELFTVSDPSYMVSRWGGIAAGRFSPDSLPTIVAVHISGNKLIAFNHDGSFKWLSPVLESVDYIVAGAPAIADLYHDGVPEIVFGRHVLNSDGTIRWNGAGGSGDAIYGPIAVVADLDLDGNPEIVAGNTAYTSTGSILWQASSIPDGLGAVANFDNDPYPEVVVVGGGKVTLLRHDGSVKWGPVAIPGSTRGGPPTVADLDGDGVPEIGIAGQTSYCVYNANGSIKWQAAKADLSSNTGSSVFDFDGDGAAEVVYRDENKLHVYRGVDGVEVYSVPISSATVYEYPIVADVDGDGHADILTVANNEANTAGSHGTLQGVFVFGDPNWVATRKIWNEHAYHITNVNDDGSIPIREKNNWQSPTGHPFNNYRQNILTTASPLAAVDLTTSWIRCSPATITARIGNGGSNVAPAPVKVAFYEGDPGNGGTRIQQSQTTRSLNPGQYEDVRITIASPQVGSQTIWVRADDDGTGRGQIKECTESNNACFTIDCDKATPALASLVESSVESGRIHLDWLAGEGTATASVERSVAGGPWVERAVVTIDGTRHLVFVDADVVPGTRYGYRLRLPGSTGAIVATAETWIDVPGLALALEAVKPNPSRGEALSIRFVLPDATPRSLDMVDVAGRLIVHREVGHLGAGAHSLTLTEGRRLGPGVYWVRLQGEQRILTTRAVVIQ